MFSKWIYWVGLLDFLLGTCRVSEFCPAKTYPPINLKKIDIWNISIKYIQSYSNIHLASSNLSQTFHIDESFKVFRPWWPLDQRKLPSLQSSGSWVKLLPLARWHLQPPQKEVACTSTKLDPKVNCLFFKTGALFLFFFSMCTANCSSQKRPACRCNLRYQVNWSPTKKPATNWLWCGCP